MIYKGDIGVIFEVTFVENDVPVDLTNVADVVLYFEKPTKEVVSVSKSGNKIVLKDLQGGVVQYVSEPGLFDVPGYWNIYGKIVFVGGTQEYRTAKIQFEVGE